MSRRTVFSLLLAMAVAATLPCTSEALRQLRCILAVNCDECLAQGGGCAWQPVGGLGGACLPRCLLQDASCFTGGDPAVCPEPDASCSAQTTCTDCTQAGCVFQDGACQPECGFGLLGGFLGLCLHEPSTCPADNYENDSNAQGSQQPEEDVIACITLYDPVCHPNGTQAGSNDCFAAANPDNEGLEFRREWCNQPKCEDYAGDCTSCLDAGCAYQGEGSCLDGCLIQDISCFRGDPAVCPKPESVCSLETTCEGCAAAGCVFQDGACQPECEFGPLGAFLATCYSSAEQCPQR